MRNRRGEKGQAMILLAGAMLVLIAITGLVIDAGRGYSARRSMEAAAEAAAHAGAYKLETSWDGSGFGTLTDATVQQVAKTYASYNGWGAPTNYNGDFNGNYGGGQFFLTYVAGDGATTNTSLTSSARGVLVQLSAPQTSTFLQLIGFRTYDIFGRATAMFGSAVSAPALPLVVNDDAFTPSSYCVPPNPCSPAGFQPAQAGGGFGTFNFVSIVPPGCAPADQACYLNALRNGATPPIGVARSYPTNSWDAAALSSLSAGALRERINARPAETCTNFTQPSPRVVFLPIANGDIGGASVGLIRFRAVFLTSIVPPSGFTGCFVRASVSSGDFDPNAVGTGYGGVTIMKLVRSPGTVVPTTVSLVSISAPAHASQPATLTVRTAANAFCTVVVSDPNPSSARGLGAAYADASGVATWTWIVDPTAPPGTWPVTVACSYQALVGRMSTWLSVN
jgi:Flp pilus assembly protein TadG